MAVLAGAARSTATVGQAMVSITAVAVRVCLGVSGAQSLILHPLTRSECRRQLHAQNAAPVLLIHDPVVVEAGATTSRSSSRSIRRRRYFKAAGTNARTESAHAIIPFSYHTLAASPHTQPNGSSQTHSWIWARGVR